MQIALAVLTVLLLALSPVGCGAPPKPTPPVSTATAETAAPPEAIPLGRLPSDVRPLRYDLEIEIVPKRETFRGAVGIDIKLDKPRRVIWIHGNGLSADDVQVTPKDGSPVGAIYEQVDAGGVVKLSLESEIPAGEARIAIEYRAQFGKKLNGLYRVVTKGDHYAFTQMEPVWTRKAFPCFNEPAFKVPWDVRLVVDANDAVVANTKEIGREDIAGGMQRVRFATTEPIPSYLIAFAVGPLDIVEAPDIAPNATREKPLPFRGIAAKGRGPELKYALEHTPPMLKVLEDYFGIGYPYDKLDIIAVPDKGGAMENVGLITFREWLLLLHENSPIVQQRAFAYVMAHELAHMWFGNLVTMPWWDDIWLNEAFATWMGYRTVQTWRPENQAEVRMLSAVHGAMGSDSLIAARQIRQPVANNNDIHNAFDRITYRKGGGVLGMFERWMGDDVFRKGLRAYMQKHRHGSATADDLLAALSATAGKDVATPFRTFLTQPGLPNIDAELDCSVESEPKLKLSQSRYLPLGSAGSTDQRWQIPVCAKYDGLESCMLLREKTAAMPLKGGTCPQWVTANAGGVGYYQWSLPAAQLKKLVKKGMSNLTVREKMSLAKAVRGAFSRGKIDAAEALAIVEPLAADPHPSVATAPMFVLRAARHWAGGDEALLDNIAAVARKLYRRDAAKLGWTTRPGESPETKLLRRNVLSFMARVGRDEVVRKQGTQLARRYLGFGGDNKLNIEAIDPNLAALALSIAGEDADAKLYDAMLYHFDNAPNGVVRNNTLGAISAAHDPKLAQRSLDLILYKNAQGMPAMKVSELMVPLAVQMNDHRTRAGARAWLDKNIDAMIALLPDRRAGWLPGVMDVFCEAKDAKAAEALFTRRLPQMAGGPRELKKAVENITICSAKRERHLPSIRKLVDQK